jgi:hypothetical protein
MDYLCISHTIVYLSDVFPTVSDLSQSLFIFTLIDVPMFWLFLIVDRFHWFRCYNTFGLWSLWTISHIWTLWHHFDPSDVTITYTSPTTPIKKEKYFTLRSQDLVRLCITSIWLRLCSLALLDLILCTSTSTHHVLSCYTAFFWLFFVLAHVLSVSLRSRSFFCYLHRTAYTNPLIHSHTLIWPLLSRISPLSHPFIIHIWPGTDLPGLSHL